MKRIILATLFSLYGSSLVTAQTPSNVVPYSLSNFAATTFATAGGQGSAVIEYGKLQPSAGTAAPAAFAIFGYRANGTLVSEASVPAMTPMSSGRTYAEVNGLVNTGIALANANAFPVVVSFNFTDQAGNDFGQGSFTVGAGMQIAGFLNQAPFNASSSFIGTFTFNASAPIGVIALRGFTNERNEFTVTTQNVVSTSSVSTSPVVIAQFADGGGWKTQVILVNPSDQAISGTIRFYGDGAGSTAATILTLTANGGAAAAFRYSIPKHSSFNLVTDGSGAVLQDGSVRITPDSGSNAPSASALFSFASNNVTTAQASTSAQPAGTAFRLYVESTGTAGAIGSIQSGVAITNTSVNATTVQFELITLAGASTGLTGSMSISGSGHVAAFLGQLVPNAPVNFYGLLRITANQAIAVTGLRTRYNERGDFLIATTPASDESSAAITSDLIFPHVVDMGGYTTQFVLFNGVPNEASAGTVRFYNQNGSDAAVILAANLAGGNANTTPTPQVIATDATNGANGVPINKQIVATFNEAMDPTTISTSTFTLLQGGSSVPGNVAYSGTTASFIPAGNLAYNTTYTAAVLANAKSLSGSKLANNFVWTFTTGPAPAAAPTNPTSQISLVTSANVNGSFVSNQSVYADQDRIYLCSFQGDLFVLARDRSANFPVIQTISIGAPLAAVRGDANNIYVASSNGNLYVYSKTRPLQLLRSVHLSDYGLSALEIANGNVYVAKGQAAMTAAGNRVYLSQLNQGDFAINVNNGAVYGEQGFVAETTTVLDSQTQQTISSLANPTSSHVNISLWNSSIFLTTPGGWSSGIDIVDATTFHPIQHLTRSTNVVAGTQNNGVNQLIAGSEDGSVDFYRIGQTGYQLTNSVDLRAATGFTGSEDIEIRALWVDGIDNLVFAASSWGNDTSRTSGLPAFFVLAIQ